MPGADPGRIARPGSAPRMMAYSAARCRDVPARRRLDPPRAHRPRSWLALLCVALLASVVSCGGREATTGTTGCTRQDPALRAEAASAVAQVLRDNVSRQEALVHPSKAYAGVWLRDSFWTFLGIGDATLAGRALRHFAGRQLPTGQLPTQFVNFLRHPLYHPDESTLLYVIWAGWQAQQHAWHPSLRSLKLAMDYVRRQVRQGLFQSRPGSYASWFDGFKLHRVDTLSYNQGLYATALLAAQHLGLGVGDGEVAAAINGYRSLEDPAGGYLRFSRGLAYHDISGLSGEFLALWLYRRAMLSDRVVAATLRTQATYQSGFRVVTDAHGVYLSHHAFVTHFFPGDYQNGGSWLLYDYLGLATGALHGVQGAQDRLAARLRLEFRQGATFHEYLNTDSHSPLVGAEPAFRDIFSWDVFITRVDAVLAERASACLRQNTGHA